MTQGWKTILTLTGCCHSSTFFQVSRVKEKLRFGSEYNIKASCFLGDLEHYWIWNCLRLRVFLPAIPGFSVFNCGYFYLRLRVFSLRLRVFCLRLRVFCLRLRVFLPAIAGTFAFVCKYFHLQLLVFLLQIECIIACKSWQFCMPVAGKFALVPMYNYL